MEYTSFVNVFAMYNTEDSPFERRETLFIPLPVLEYFAFDKQAPISPLSPVILYLEKKPQFSEKERVRAYQDFMETGWKFFEQPESVENLFLFAFEDIFSPEFRIDVDIHQPDVPFFSTTYFHSSPFTYEVLMRDDGLLIKKPINSIRFFEFWSDLLASEYFEVEFVSDKLVEAAQKIWRILSTEEGVVSAGKVKLKAFINKCQELFGFPETDSSYVDFFEAIDFIVRKGNKLYLSPPYQKYFETVLSPYYTRFTLLMETPSDDKHSPPIVVEDSMTWYGKWGNVCMFVDMSDSKDFKEIQEALLEDFHVLIDNTILSPSLRHTMKKMIKTWNMLQITTFDKLQTMVLFNLFLKDTLLHYHELRESLGPLNLDNDEKFDPFFNGDFDDYDKFL